VLSVPAPVEKEPLRCETRPVPSPANDEILVRVSACGVCRTDLHIVEGELPLGARPDLSVDGTIELDRLKDVLYVGRPAFGQEKSLVGLFRLNEDGDEAMRVKVKLGKSSVNTVEILEGLKPGDRVILSDMSAWDAHDRVRLK